MDETIDIHVPAQGDGSAIARVAASTPLFTEEEVATVKELWDDFIASHDQQEDYRFLAAYKNGALAGFSCYGHRALTKSAFDLYWIAVDSEQQHHGIGRLLLLETEKEIKKLGGTIIVVETSSSEAYTPTRKFYLAQNYRVAGEIADFYEPGDGLMLFIKAL
jgi:ribosomal protein S18 acetylase RimI-like enzyme